MAGIITMTLETKALYDNMSDTLRPIFFKTYDNGDWSLKETDSAFHAYIEHRDADWELIYGSDTRLNLFCELDYRRNDSGEMVPYEFSVWNARVRTYHRFF